MLSGRSIAIDLASVSARTDFYALYGKRLVDFVLSAVVLLLVFPLLLLIGGLVMLDSPGPPLFVQERVGKNGTRFRVFKFRTMYANNNDSIHKQHIQQIITQNTKPLKDASLKLNKDPRITPFGSFLRRTSLDELPQFLNVLRGDMSVVGPRPDVPYALAAYKPWYHERFRAMPGITGYWQVEARNRVNYEQMIQMDIEYYQRQNLWWDLLLILKTPWAMLTGRGAG